jgi:endonuclease/exonuclease/phosphatase family metal-dependent hydrolase
VLVAVYACDKPEDSDWENNSDLKIMSFNLRFDTEEDGENKWDNRKEACVKMLNDLQPSIFGIQEGLYNQVRFLDDQLQRYSYVGVGRDDGYSGGEHSAIFYDTLQFDLHSKGDFWLSETPDYPSLGWDANNIRIVSWAMLYDLLKQDTVYFFNTHFDHIGKTAQLESAKLLMQKINEIVIPQKTVFITGDFNVLIRNEALTPILKEFFSAQRFAEHTDGKNSYNGFGRWYISRNIDFVFFKNAKAKAYRTVTEDYGVPFISDHYPIISYINYSK